jgi:hypothetical protein
MTSISGAVVNPAALEVMTRRKRWSLTRILKGLCGQCGKYPKAEKSTSRCAVCLEKQRVINHTKYQRKTRALQPERLTYLQTLATPTAEEAEELRKLLIHDHNQRNTATGRRTPTP